MTGPETSRDPVSTETIDRVKRAAQNILDIVGVDTHGGSMQSATFGVEYSALTDHPEGALPTIKINKALGELATEARWDFEIGVRSQDTRASRHIFFMKDSSAQPEVAYYDGQADRTMTELEALAIAADLERARESYEEV